MHPQPIECLEYLGDLDLADAAGGSHYFGRGAPRPPNGRIGSAENHYRRHAERSGHMSRAGIVAHEQRCRAEQAFNFGKRRAGLQARGR